MAQKKLFAGVALRQIRQRFTLSQAEFAARIGISLPYLSQMENNHRPISTTVILALAREFKFDVTELAVGDTDRMVADMKEALADAIFGEQDVSTADLQLAASNAPGFAHAFLELHRAYRQSQERLAAFDDALGQDIPTVAPSPWEEVRDFFHYCDNYIDSVDQAAEAFAKTVGYSFDGLRTWLLETQSIQVNLLDTDTLREFDETRRIIFLSQSSTDATQYFQLAHQVALAAYDPLLEATLDLARFQTDEARAICKIGLANYFAGAVVLPYARFLQAAQETRHDLELLARRFSASIEQVAHRLSTLQRPGLKGIPFFFFRVDQAGTITKRHSATRLQFARFGGACPLWNAHSAFETPGRFLRQLAETPDGARYFCLARDVSKPGGAYNAPTRRFAIGLGCEVRHAGALVYADDMDLRNDRVFEPIGVSCRICERANCHQRSVPPLEHKITVDPNARGILPYKLDRD